MDQYAEASGSKVNQDKCEVLWMGREGESFSLPDAFRCLIRTSKCWASILALLITASKLGNPSCRIPRSKVRCWKRWRLSLRERVDLIKTFLLPVFLYVSIVCLLPESLYTRIYNCFFQMLWGNRLNLVKRDVTYSSWREGGLGMVNPVVFFSLMFLKRNMLAERPPAWVGLFRIWFRPFLCSWESGGPVRSLRVKHGGSWVRGLWHLLSMHRWP
ncbi:unnamed protein product [Staurois parvus]|uniref:Uncharacterized protein n=1 Tax=Staurois parvus TaxID=386267 RepID=A0ABN9GHV3_9NEOB|nr:unnamed protein product [Staurois parvus]